MEQLYAEILEAGNNPDALRQIAIRYGLDPSFVASVASGTGRTTMAQSFDPSLLVAAGIISPDVLSQGLAGAGEAAYQDALREWMADAQKFQGTAPQLNSVIDYTYANRYGGDHPVMNLFNDIRNGKSADQVIVEAESVDADGTSYKNQLINSGLFNSNDWLTLQSDLKDFGREVGDFRQDEYEFMLKSDPNSPQYQADMASLGAMPTRETFDTSQARLDYAKALGMPALALLPDPAQGAYVSQEEFEGALGGRDRFKALQDYITTFDERALRPVEEPVGGRIQGYGADRRAGGIGEGRQGMTPEEIRQIDIKVADEKNARVNAGLMKLERELLAGKPNPFQEALKQFNIFGALEANV